jgi:hypothetical protein
MSESTSLCSSVPSQPCTELPLICSEIYTVMHYLDVMEDDCLWLMNMLHNACHKATAPNSRTPVFHPLTASARQHKLPFPGLRLSLV